MDVDYKSDKSKIPLRVQDLFEEFKEVDNILKLSCYEERIVAVVNDTDEQYQVVYNLSERMNDMGIKWGVELYARDDKIAILIQDDLDYNSLIPYYSKYADLGVENMKTAMYLSKESEVDYVDSESYAIAMVILVSDEKEVIVNENNLIHHSDVTKTEVQNCAESILQYM